jgi:hypothetical protein
MGALMGRIGGEGGKVILIGDGPVSLPAGYSGNLELCINDDLKGHYGAGLTDNQGRSACRFSLVKCRIESGKCKIERELASAPLLQFTPYNGKLASVSAHHAHTELAAFDLAVKKGSFSIATFEKSAADGMRQHAEMPYSTG